MYTQSGRHLVNILQDELTEGEDEWGRTVMISRREKEMLDPLSKRTHRVKG